MKYGEPTSEDLAALRGEFPGWQFGSVWTTAATGPDARRIWGYCPGIGLLTAWTRAELAASIRREDSDL